MQGETSEVSQTSEVFYYFTCNWIYLNSIPCICKLVNTRSSAPRSLMRYKISEVLFNKDYY